MQTLLLGTARWGSDYGVSNDFGRLTDSALVELLEAARGLDVTLVDTAPAYGNPEARIGRTAPVLRFQIRVDLVESAPSVADQVIDSSELTRQAVLWGMLVHD